MLLREQVMRVVDQFTSGLEAERLVVQHNCMISCQGYYLHPEVKPSTTAPRIADLATGTGIWLCELAPAYPQAELHGFDISDKMFPSQESIPSNVKLHTADIKKSFDQAWLGYFDVVNIPKYDIVLGLPFMYATRMVIDFGDRSIRVNTVRFPLRGIAATERSRDRDQVTHSVLTVRDE